MKKVININGRKFVVDIQYIGNGDESRDRYSVDVTEILPNGMSKIVDNQVSTISNESISTLDDAFRAAKEILCDKISKGFL